MGGSIGFTAIKGGKTYKMTRWTNSMPNLVNSIQFLQPELDPEATEQHFQGYMKSWFEMKADWEKNGPQGPFEFQMTTSYFGEVKDGMYPDGYGLVVCDFDRKKLYHCQGYCGFGKFSPMIDLDYKCVIEGDSSRTSKESRKALINDVKPLFDKGYMNTLRFRLNFDEHLKPLGETEYGRGKYDIVDVSGLDLRWGDDFDLRCLGIAEEAKKKLNPAKYIISQDFLKRNKDLIPERVWNGLQFAEKNKNLYCAYDLIPTTDWEFIRFEENYGGYMKMFKELEKHYIFTDKEKDAWDEWLQELKEEWDEEEMEDESEITQ